MMAEGSIDACLKSITVPKVDDFKTNINDYTDVDESFFTHEHEEMEDSAKAHEHDEMEDTAKDPPRSTRRRRSRASLAAQRETRNSRLKKNTKMTMSIPDVSSPARKRQRKFLGDVSNTSTNSEKLLISRTPNVLKRGLELRARARRGLKTTEELEAEKLQAEKEHIEMVLAKSKESYAQVKASKPAPVKRGAPATQPQEFHFATDSRVKEAKKVEGDTKAFTESLRKSEKETFKIPKSGRTEPKPFNLTENKRKRATTEEKPTAEAIRDFLNPSHRSCEKELPEKGEQYHNRLATIPQTPKFATKRVRRNVYIESEEERQKKEFEEECVRNQFKAHRLNKQVLKSKAPLKEVEKRPTTKIEPFQIRDEERKKEKVIEKPQEPKKRERTGPIQPEPFSFDKKDELRKEKKNQKIKEVLEREKKLHEFKANKMPIYDQPHGIPEVEPPKATKVKPFNLSEPEKKPHVEEERYHFRARPATVLVKQPFVPKPSDLPPVTTDKAFTLHTDERSEAREKFEVDKKNKEAEILAMNKQKEEADQIEEEERLKQERAARVHKAKPVQHYNPVEIKLGTKEPTLPISPNFSDRFKK